MPRLSRVNAVSIERLNLSMELVGEGNLGSPLFNRSGQLVGINNSIGSSGSEYVRASVYETIRGDLLASRFVPYSGFPRLYDPQKLIGLARPVSRSVVAIMSGDEQVALGLIVTADGDIVTKASEMPESITCRLTDGRVLKGSVAGRSFAHDLAVLKVEAKGLPVAEWSNRIPQSGMILASIGPRGQPRSLGVVGSPVLTVPSEKGTLDIDVEDVKPGTAGVAIERVPPTAKTLQSNDIVTHVGGHATLSVGEFKEWMQWFLASDQAIAGERIALGIQREGKKIDVKVRLESSAPEIRMPRWDRDLEGRHTGFPAVFIHDALVRQPRPKDISSSFVARTDLGGPVVDCEGKIVGINIGSHSGVFSYAIPAPIIRKVVEEVRAK